MGIATAVTIGPLASRLLWHPCLTQHHESQFNAYLAWKCAKSYLRRLTLSLFETRPGNVPKLASEGSFWAFLSLGLECDKSDRRRLTLSLFETRPCKCAKTRLRRHILSLFEPGPGNVPKWSQKLILSFYVSEPDHHHHHHLSIATAGTMGPLASRLLWHLCLTHMHMLGKSKASLINLHVQ